MSQTGNTFRTAEPSLSELLESIHTGKIQLPDFQRGWVWNDNHIKSLLASISRSFPIGSVMLLENGGDSVRFKPRAVQGTPVNDTTPNQLILDGQQRMTSLYSVLRSGKPVQTRTEKKKKIHRYYYLNMAACLDPEIDREDAVISIAPDRVIRTNFNRDVELDLSTREKEYENDYFPLSVLFSADYYEWCEAYRRYHNYNSEKMTQLGAFELQIVQRFRTYRVPAIELTRETSREAVCLVFEKVNTGGVALTVFELMTATFAADEYDLRQDWNGRKERLAEKPVLSSVSSTDFLQTVTLLASYQKYLKQNTGITCKRRDILKLTIEQYKSNADLVEEGFYKAARFLVREKIFDARNLPYRKQLVPLVTICAVLGNRFDSDAVKQKLSRWYWCGVFGELYGGTAETRFVQDVTDVVEWVCGGPDPRTIRDASLSPTRLLTLQSRNSAAYKGMMALLMRVGSADFINGDDILLTTYFDEAIDIHHIFPRSYCKKKGFPSEKWNSVVNKAPLTSRTNRTLGGKAPSHYLAKIEEDGSMSSERLDKVLITHLIHPALLRGDDFDGFIRDRASQILNKVEEVMGKAIVGRDADDVIAAFGGALTTA